MNFHWDFDCFWLWLCIMIFNINETLLSTIIRAIYDLTSSPWRWLRPPFCPWQMCRWGRWPGQGRGRWGPAPRTDHWCPGDHRGGPRQGGAANTGQRADPAGTWGPHLTRVKEHDSYSPADKVQIVIHVKCPGKAVDNTLGKVTVHCGAICKLNL